MLKCVRKCCDGSLEINTRGGIRHCAKCHKPVSYTEYVPPLYSELFPVPKDTKEAESVQARLAALEEMVESLGGVIKRQAGVRREGQLAQRRWNDETREWAENCFAGVYPHHKYS